MDHSSNQNNQQNMNNNLPVLVNNSAGGQMVAYDPLNQQNQFDEEAIDLRALWRVVVRHKKLIGIIFSVIVLTALIITLLMRPMYTSSSLVEINTSGRSLVKFQNVESQDIASREYMSTQTKIIQSEAVIYEVVKRLKLTEEPEFNGSLTQRGLLNGVKSLIHLLKPRDEAKVDANKIAAGIYQERLQVSTIRNSTLVNVGFESFSPEMAAKIANEHVSAYIWLNDERRFSSTSGAKEFLEKEISSIQAKLETSEKQLTQFARKHGIVDVEDRNNIIMNRLIDMNAALSVAQNQRIDAETKHEQSKSASSSELAVVFDDELIKTLREEQSKYKSEHLELGKIYKAQYPLMVQLEAKINEIEANIQSQAGKIVSGLSNSYEQLVQKESRIKEELEKLKDDMLNLKDRAVTYNILKREWEANKELYSGLLERTKEVGVAAGMELNVASKVDTAKPSEDASSPNLKLNLLIASFLGLAAGLGTAFLLAMLDNTINDVEQLQQITHIGHLGVAPEIDDGDTEHENEMERVKVHDTIVNTDPTSPFSEAIQSVRTSLAFARAGGFPKSIMVTSTVPGEGKSTVSINLAISCAKAGQRVIIIESDLRRSRFYKVFGLPASPGLSDYLVNEDALPTKQPISNINNLDVIVGGSKSANPTDLLSSEKMRQLVQRLEDEYDVVIIDCPPVLGLADSLIISNIVKGTLYVVSAHTTAKDAIKNAMQRLRMVNAPLIGTVLNKVDTDVAGYNYDYYDYLGTAEQTS